MKVQDILFLIILAFLIYKHIPKLFVIAGIIALILSIPLFSLWVFFTAERLIWYAVAFFLLAIVLNVLQLRSINDR